MLDRADRYYPNMTTMPEEPFALSTISPPHAEESDYAAICATVMESARGRWFLEQYARRNRNADKKLMLAAIEHLELLIRTEPGQQAHPGMRAELLEMARAIAQARAGGAQHPDAHPQAAGAEQRTPRLTLQAYRTGWDRRCRLRVPRPLAFPLHRSSPTAARREQPRHRARLRA